MKSLLIIANPAKKSFSHALAQAYESWAKKRGDECYTLNLYDVDQSFLNYEDVSDLKSEKYEGKSQQEAMQKLLIEHDEYVFFFPVWWGNMPAILKNFFDCNFSAGFAFKFVSGKSMPEKLLIDKTAKIYTHCDAPRFLYSISGLMGINILRYMKKCILEFCGVKVTHWKLYGNISKKTHEEKQKILDTLCQK